MIKLNNLADYDSVPHSQKSRTQLFAIFEKSNKAHYAAMNFFKISQVAIKSQNSSSCTKAYSPIFSITTESLGMKAKFQQLVCLFCSKLTISLISK